MKDIQEVGAELGAVALRTSPGVAASALTMNQIVAFLTAVFLALQIGHLAWKWHRDWRASREAEP